LIKVLLLEDLAVDAELARDALQQAGLRFEMQHVAEEEDYLTVLQSGWPDIVVADYSLPRFDGAQALALRARTAPDVPFVFLTGSLGEERAVETLRSGATDYVLKTSLPRLPVAVLRALAEADAARDQARVERELEEERQLLEAVLTTTGALIVVLNNDARISQLNPSAIHSSGRNYESLLGQPFVSVFANQDERDWVDTQLARLGELNTDDARNVTWRSRIGVSSIQWAASRLPKLDGQAPFAVLAGIDVTEQEIAEQQAHFLRHYDSLTGLPNRDLLKHRLTLMQLGSGEKQQALVLIGVDRLADIRDSLGSAISNQLLHDIARRLSAWQQPTECVARVGDISFALILEVANEAELIRLLRQLLAILRNPHHLNGRDFFLPAYVGAVMHTPNADPEAMLQSAEAALHRATGAMGEGFQLYESTLSVEVTERLMLEAELRVALRDPAQLELHYQPQVSLKSGQIVGVEALLRWQHPRLGLLPPSKFIAFAESCGLIGELGRLVLRTACRQAQAWQDAGLPKMTMAVNLAAAEWSNPQLLAQVTDALSQSGLAPGHLELELTESTSMHDPDSTIETMARLKEMGIHVSIDDFGTGYCNLNYLKRFPVDRLKLDRSFVQDITVDPDDLAISRTVVAIAHQLRLEVVAEGVETEGQLALLAAMGCDIIQGYYFSRPLPADACARLLAERPTLTLGSWRSNRRTLLLVDDETGVLTAVQRLLRGHDYRVLATQSPAEAFELLATHNVGVVISDQRMPELNGTEFLNRVKDMYPDTIRIILSGYTDLQTITDAVNRGYVYKFLTKPWEDQTLLEAIADAFEKHESNLPGGQGTRRTE